MKRGTKIWLIVALIFGLIGGGLCLSAAILGVSIDDVNHMVYEGDFVWRIGPFRWIHREASSEIQTDALDDRGQDKVTLQKPTDRMQICIDYGSLTVKTSGSSEAWMDAGDDAEYFEWSYDGSTLSVKNDDDSFDWLNIGDDRPKATLYIPEDSFFSAVDIDMDAGSCTIEVPIRCDIMDVDVDAGVVDLKNVNTAWLGMDCDAGKISFQGQAADGGDVDVDAGSIEIALTGAEVTDYNYDIDVNAGSLSINDKSFSGLEKQTYIDNDGAADWAISCDAGKISMQIKNK